MGNRRELTKGFTMIELIVFVAIFTVAMGAFLSTFTDVGRVAITQSSAAEVRSQSQFVLQTVQYYVERSSLVDMDADTPTSTLTLWLPEDTEDPTVLRLDNGALKISVGGGAEQALTSAKVEVTELEFVKRDNPGGPTSVAVAFTISYATNNPAQSYTAALQTAVTRAAAATFDSDIVPPPGSSGDWDLGDAPGDWKTINGTIYLSDTGNVGIGSGASSPGTKLEVDGDIYISDTTKGLILKSGASACWRVSVNGSGALTTATTTCL